MPLPKIYSPTTVVLPAQEEKVVPAVPEKNYPDSYLVNLNISPPNAESVQRMTVTFRPYNYATGEIYPNNDKNVTLVVSNILTEAARSTMVAQTMGAVVQTASLLLKESNLQKQLKAAKTDEEKAAIQTELDATKQTLGITS